MAFWSRGRAKFLAALVLVPGLLIVLLRWFEQSQVYHPSRRTGDAAGSLGRPWTDAAFRSRDGVALHGWFFPAVAHSPRRDWVVLHCHGNAGNVSHRLGVVGALLESGVNVFVFDYRGYGRSDGRPSEEGTYLDGQAAYGWLRQRGFAARRIVVWGESLGGGVAAELACREEVGALVLQSTFTSVPDLGAELFPFLPVRWLARIRYDTLSKLPAVHCPVLVMHSPEDTLIPVAHARRNFAAANEPRQWTELAGDHNDFLEAGRAQWVKGWEAFLGRLEDPASPGPDAVAPR